MSRTRWKINVKDLHGEVKLAEGGKATPDKTVAAIYKVGAAIVERLDRIATAVDELSGPPTRKK